jgi:DNA polymerase (family 10)
MVIAIPTNKEIAAVLDSIADYLAAGEENPFRVRSYRTAAQAIRSRRSSLGEKVKESGVEVLEEIPGVGSRIAGVVEEYVKTGKVSLLESLRKETSEEELARFKTGQKGEQVRPAGSALPPVPLILAMDEEYRSKAGAGKLKRIAPRLFNPEKKAWLPILAATRDGWKFTLMFSNTSTAHKLGKTDDWVVVYAARGKSEQQCTVVTEQRGSLKGKRVIRGHEADCEKYYADHNRKSR